ncbi:Pentatricopeptide repeat-containing protein [Thalictrum thalictroides]|uniref:Pentatricopeptide repeat-containing protein n=1 Tax=Thalictrum thalictroides TaxID=46969 RepID=A0A7J6VA45_THATH|nr:Pentatricopeptide repeat-containing protein [Thalictrum thalictroides]
MKLGFSSKGLKPLSKPTLSRVCNALFYSTDTQTSIPIEKKDTLYKRISSLSDPRVSIVPILDQWVTQGKKIELNELQSYIKRLKRFKRYNHALEISQWMADRNHNVNSVRDNIVRLDLIAKVHGIEQAEEYFNKIPTHFKGVKIYTILLELYVKSQSFEKAESLMEQMRKLGLATSTVAYNSMLKLYAMVGQYKKMDTLMEEMNKKRVSPNMFTFCIRLNAYAATSDISGMEKFLQWMESDCSVLPNTITYTTAANGYIKAGLVDQGLEMLKKLEGLVSAEKGRWSGYETLLTLYASIGRKEDLYRVWMLCKSSGKVYNTLYHCMIASLLKLEDIDGAKNILEEWETENTSNDFRIPNLLIAAYCKKNLLEKAEMFINKAMENGKKPYASTWEILASGYIEANQISKAVESIKATLLERSWWKPRRETLAICLLYVKQQGDAAKTEEFVRLLGVPCHMSTDDCGKLLDYFYNNESEVDKFNELNADGLDDDDEETDIISKEAT